MKVWIRKGDIFRRFYQGNATFTSIGPIWIRTKPVKEWWKKRNIYVPKL